MKRVLAIGALAFFSLSSFAAEVKNQDLRIFDDGKLLGQMHLKVIYESDKIILKNESSAMMRLTKAAPLKNYTARATHVFNKDWKWLSSELWAAVAPNQPITLTVTDKTVTYKSNFNKTPRIKNFDYKGQAMPRRALYSYLRGIPPLPAMEPREIFLFNEFDSTLNKATLTYLGMEKTAKGIVHKYEVKDALSTMITFSDKGDIVKIKELDFGVDIQK
jgi:hypothetical protein